MWHGTIGWDFGMFVRHCKAVIMDVDGTMYSQRPVRLHMAARLASFTLKHPVLGLRTVRCLRAFRQAQEELRSRAGTSPLFQDQLEHAARRCGCSGDFVEECVHRWMETAPLEAIRKARYPGLPEFCAWAKQAGLALAVLSDYDPREKLRVLEVAKYFPVVVCAQDPDIGVFKPNPAGLRAAVERLRATPEETVYVGDRPEIDGAVAVAAGVTGIILYGPAHRMPQPLIAVNGWPALLEFSRSRDLDRATAPGLR
ncbi:MAG: HAD family hydrolase [Acidobacteria bacterium]|nr:HAD family hydrolase [Acidobacteriota bacterium]